MAGKKISEMAAAVTPLSGSELVPVVQSGANKRVAVSALMVAGPAGPQGPAGPMGPQGPKGDADWTKQQAVAAPLTGLNTSLTGNITASDTVLSAMGKLQAHNLQIEYEKLTVTGEGFAGDLSVARIFGKIYFFNTSYLGVPVKDNWTSIGRVKVATPPSWWDISLVANVPTNKGGVFKYEIVPGAVNVVTWDSAVNNSSKMQLSASMAGIKSP